MEDQVRAKFDAWWKQRRESLNPSMRFVIGEFAFDGWQAATASHAAEVEALRKALAGLLHHVDRETCTHDDTYRGGAIWTICRQCDRKWADDRGGFQPHTDSPEVSTARAALKGDKP